MSFPPEDQRAFLRFVTSVSRGPLLGFRYLEPPLCIQVSAQMLSKLTSRFPAAKMVPANAMFWLGILRAFPTFLGQPLPPIQKVNVVAHLRSYQTQPACMQMAGGVLDEASAQRLPSAATCMNLLKLPPYRSLPEMQAKLRYAIHEVSGFELS